MTETREQFRDRIRALYWTVYNKVMRAAGPYGNHRAETFAAEAVYTQALRDVLSMKQSGDWDDAEIVYVHDIESYAGYHGISLEDES